MINQNELRRGNLFIEKYSQQIIPVLELLRNGSTVFDFDNGGKIWQAEPLPITKEWLLKFGFNDKIWGGWLSIKINDEMSLAYYEGFQGISFATSAIHGESEHIKYVHQLQNLYFALTGQELTIQN